MYVLFTLWVECFITEVKSHILLELHPNDTAKINLWQALKTLNGQDNKQTNKETKKLFWNVFIYSTTLGSMKVCKGMSARLCPCPLSMLFIHIAFLSLVSDNFKYSFPLCAAKVPGTSQNTILYKSLPLVFY